MVSEKLLKNKKGQDLSIGTLILIVLGIVVLVLLILGFSIGWQNLWDRINIFQAGSSIESVISACNIAAASNSQYSYCENFHQVRIDRDTEYINCEDLRVSNSLQETIDCPKTFQAEIDGGEPETGLSAAAKKCLELNPTDDETYKINGRTITATVDCRTEFP